ncbi:MAG TPA: M48 family metallopeptidase [Phycisphaerales bacterium]|nr:M48 family metallopeptidase [Phycisphaerales bacterium]
MTTNLARTLALAALATASIFAAACSTNPTTGRKQFTSLSRDEEVHIGMTEGPKMTQEFGGEVPDPRLRAYIDEVGQKLKNYTEVDGPTRTWTFTLLDSDVINAFALPGERVFMSRGLSDQLTSEAQLAGVLGHEIGHVMARHTSERLAQSQYVGLGAQLLGAIAGASTKNATAAQAIPQLVGAGGQVIVLKFGREQESEADSLGMRYMTKAGYNPRGQLQVMEVLKRESGGGGSIEWLSTHPAPQTRIDDIKHALATTYAYTQSGPQAGNFQDYTDRYRQRYLSLRELSPTPPKKKAALPIDEHGRTRVLAAVNLDDPTTWCSACRDRAHAEHRINVQP